MTCAQDDPADFLTAEHGLRKISGGNVWLLPAEIRLQNLLEDLGPLRRDILSVQTNLEETVQQNRVVWETSRQRIEVLRRSLNSSETNDNQRKQLERQIRELEAQAVEPAQLSGVPDVRKRLIEFTNLRLRLSLSAIEIRDLHREITGNYARLTADHDVMRALRSLGEDHRLGPLQQGYRDQLKRLAQYEQTVTTDWLPVFRQGDCFRFGGLLNDRVPVLFSWQESSEPTVLAASMVEAAGLNLPDNAEQVPLTLAGRRLTVRRVAAISLQFGSARLRDVPALVLPPEAEDLGSRIGPEGFSGYRVVIQAERLRLTIQLQ